MMENGNRVAQVQALNLLNKFSPKCNGLEVAFPGISVEEFKDSLIKMIENPSEITQSSHPICGITTALKVVAILDPVALVKMAAQLFANGVYQPKSFLVSKIKTSKSLTVEQERFGLSPAEFVLQTSIKAFYNPITGYANKPKTVLNNWQGITMPYQIKQFLTGYFRIQLIPAKTFLHSIRDIQKHLSSGNQIIAWTSWNQFKNPGGKFKITQQHYVLIKELKQVDKKIYLTIDNPKNRKQTEEFIFPDDKSFYKAIIGIYPFVKRK